jgi:alpha-L-fucosidase
MVNINERFLEKYRRVFYILDPNEWADLFAASGAK